MSSNKSPYYLPVIRGSSGDPSQPNSSTTPNFNYQNEASGKHTAYQNPHHGVTQLNAASHAGGATSHDGPLSTILRVPGDSDSDQNTPKQRLHSDGYLRPLSLEEPPPPPVKPSASNQSTPKSTRRHDVHLNIDVDSSARSSCSEDVQLPLSQSQRKRRRQERKTRKKTIEKLNEIDPQAARVNTRRKGVVYSTRYQYSVNEAPPWILTIFLAFQHYIIMFGATVANPLALAPALCMGTKDTEAFIQLVGTMFVMAGIATLLQTTIGSRLPIVQGGTFNFIASAQALMSLEKWKCQPANSVTSSIDTNSTVLMETEPEWLPRIREVQGAIIVASLLQVVVGASGILSIMLQYIGPLSIAPTIALAGLSLFPVAVSFASRRWWIALVTVLLIVAFSQYSRRVNIPCLSFSLKTGCTKDKLPIFRLFPVLMAVFTAWAISAILTAAGVFPPQTEFWTTHTAGEVNGTTVEIDMIADAPWFYFPYPGQWGWPTVSAAGVLGLLAGVLANIVEAIGDYYACARMSGIPPPPLHAINRGVAVGGFSCFMSGLWGSGGGTTSYSENIGAIGITKVASRRVFQIASIFMIVFGMFGKLGAIFNNIPHPVIGGVFIVMFGMVAAIGISNLQFVDMNSSRNLFIIGFSFFFGMSLPIYLQNNPDAIQTGSNVMDQVLTVLLRTSMFVGGLSGFVLDNTIPGSDDERGLIQWKQLSKRDELSATYDYSKLNQLYGFPLIDGCLQKYDKWLRYVPFLPGFKGHINLTCRSKGNYDPSTNAETKDQNIPMSNVR